MTWRLMLAVAVLLLAIPPVLASPCGKPTLSATINLEPLLDDARYLSSNQLQGRKTGSQGAQLAREYLSRRFAQIGLRPVSDQVSYEVPFDYQRFGPDVSGVNLVGLIPGTENGTKMIAVTAHYDHLGSRSPNHVYNGANDNASGVAAMLALATVVSQSPLKHGVVFIATDAEESGLYGARAFLRDEVVAPDKLRFNLNLDMLGNSDDGKRLYVTGKHTHDEFPTLIDWVQARAGVCLRDGHRTGLRGRNLQRRMNFQQASDHGAFSRMDIPYLFIGVVNDKHYHSTEDTFDNLSVPFFAAATETSLLLLQRMDQL